MDAPETPGIYEVRYVLAEGKKVLARAPVEVLPEDAALESGATLDAPDTAAPGTEVTVEWAVATPSADQRVTLAREPQAIFTWIAAQKAADGKPVRFTLPSEPGVYEFRFLDVTNREVLSRRVIRVR